MNQVKAPKNWLKLETSLLVFLIVAFLVTIAILMFVGWPSQLPDNFYKRLRIDKIIEIKNQIVRVRMDTVRTIATVWGAIAIIFNVYYLAKRTEFIALNASGESKKIELPVENVNVQPEELKQVRENGQLEEQEKITAQFLSAIEKLGSNDVPVRLGSIYVLERIANHSQTDYSAIVEVLTAFVRENAPFNPLVEEDQELPSDFDIDLPKAEDDVEPSQKLPVDIQAALTVLGRRAVKIDAKNYRLDLSHTDMGGASLSSANLPGAFLNGVNLQRADLLQANLQGAFLSSANLQEAFLMGAKLQGTVFRGANLQGAFLVGADLLGADLSGANLKGAFLMGANLLGANLKGANLLGADLSEAENLECGQIESAQIDSTTALPHNLKAPAEWTPTD